MSYEAAQPPNGWLTICPKGHQRLMDEILVPLKSMAEVPLTSIASGYHPEYLTDFLMRMFKNL